MTTPNNYQSKLEIIKKHFIQSLDEKLSHITRAINTIASRPLSQEEWQQLYLAIHNLKGTAPTFGFNEAGDLAQSIEQSLDLIKEEKSDWTIELTNTLQNLAQILSQIISANQTDTSSQEQTLYASKNSSIILVDDDPVIGEILQEIASSINQSIVQFKTGKEFSSQIHEHFLSQVKLILLDINLPDQSGQDLLKQLKSLEETKNIPVVILTSNEDDQSLIESISLGAMEYFTKPLNLTEIQKHIQNILELHSKTILIADDDPIIVSILQKLIESKGYHCIQASNGTEALEIIHKNAITLAILDIMMPEIDGISILKNIKSDPKTQNIPVIFLTAKTQQENILEGFHAGATDYITKPFDLDELAIRINRVLKDNE